MNLYTPLPHRNRPKTGRASSNTNKLKKPSHLEEYQRLLDEKFPYSSISSRVITLRNGPQSRMRSLQFTKEVPGPKAGIQDWFDENSESIQADLDDKNKAFTNWQNDLTSVTKKAKFKKLLARVQSQLREMQDQGRQDMAEDVQIYVDSHNVNKFLVPFRQCIAVRDLVVLLCCFLTTRH